MCCSPAIAARNTASGSIYADDLPGNRPPRSYSGAVIFMPYPQRRFNGVLRAFGVGRCLGYRRQCNTLCVAFWRDLRRRCGVVCLGGAWLPCFSRPDRGGAGASWAGGHGNGANRIDRPRNAMAQGPNPGRDSARRSAQGVE